MPICINMRLPACIVLALLSTPSVAAEKIPLTIFLNEIRDRLYTMDQPDGREPRQIAIRNIRVELNVIVDKDAQGRYQYYVLDGIMDNKDVVTQRISFDMELRRDAPVAAERKKGRVYSTRGRGGRYGDNKYYPPNRYPPYPGDYMPGIYPVIVFDEDR